MLKKLMKLLKKLMKLLKKLMKFNGSTLVYQDLMESMLNINHILLITTLPNFYL